MQANPLAPNRITMWGESQPCCDRQWEAAYERFETEEEEIAKFTRRLRRMGIDGVDRQSPVVELFCGRGNGLKALEGMGFQSLEGVDLSPDLLRKYDGPARLYAGDCRRLRFADESKELVIIQGGLHHLPSVPEDLRSVVEELHRALRPGGKAFIVEPWLTPFLRAVHLVCKAPAARSVSTKLDALAVMIEREQTTYYQWLRQPSVILDLLKQYFTTGYQCVSFGKLSYVGVKAE